MFRKQPTILKEARCPEIYVIQNRTTKQNRHSSVQFHTDKRKKKSEADRKSTQSRAQRAARTKGHRQKTPESRAAFLRRNARRCTGHPTAGKGRRADSVADTKRVAEDLDKDVGRRRKPLVRRRRPHFLEEAAEDNQSGSSTARRSHVAIRPEEVSRDRRDKDSEGARPRLESCDGVTSCRGIPATAHMGTERGVCT